VLLSTTGVTDEVELLSRKVDVRLPGKENSNSHGARLVHLIITMIKWIRASRLSIKNSLSDTDAEIFRDDSEKSHQGAAELPVEHPRPAPVHLQNLCVHLKKRMYVSIKRISGAPPRIPYARK